MTIDRRSVLFSGVTLGVGLLEGFPTVAQPNPVRDARLAALEARLGGRVGVMAVNLGSGASLAHRSWERFAMCSTFKWLLAAAALARAQARDLPLDELLSITDADLLEYAPAARQNLARGAMTVQEMCAASVELSDNTAANLLLARIGGPEGLTAFLRGIGDDVTRLDRTEPTLNENRLGDARDTTTPEAMTTLLRKILATNDVLDASSRGLLIGWMVASKTGTAKLRAGLPGSWRVGDKTGLGQNGANNDVAIAWPKEGAAPIVIASYLSEGKAEPAARDAAHAEIGRVIFEVLG
ncbi:class A beta-lactamase [soil metagenome]